MRCVSRSLWHTGTVQPFNDNQLRPCPMLETRLLREMVHKTSAKSTDLQSPEASTISVINVGLCGKLGREKAEDLGENPHHVKASIIINQLIRIEPGTAEAGRPTESADQAGEASENVAQKCAVHFPLFFRFPGLLHCGQQKECRNEKTAITGGRAWKKAYIFLADGFEDRGADRCGYPAACRCGNSDGFGLWDAKN